MDIQEKRYSLEAIEYIAKLAEGGLRDAITLLDKCLSYSSELTVDNVVKALNVADYDVMFSLNDAFFIKDNVKLIETVNRLYSSGLDLKQFIKTYFEFILDCNVLAITGDINMVKIPSTWIDVLRTYGDPEWDEVKKLMKFLVDLQYSIKYEQNPKSVIIAKFVLFNEE